MFHRKMIGDDLHPPRLPEIAGTPIGALVPDYIGQLVTDNTADTLFRATGLTDVDWVIIGGAGDISTLSALTDVNIAGRADKYQLIWDQGTSKHIFIPSIVEKVVTVAKSGGDFTTIKDALDSITDNSETVRYTVNVAPGLYTENNPIQGKSYVNVFANTQHSVRVIAGNPNQDLFLSAHLFYLLGLSMADVVGVDNYAINHSVAGEGVAKECVFTNCSNGILLNNTNGLYNVLEGTLYTTGGTMDRGIRVLEGNMTIDFLKVVLNSTVGKAITVEGPNTYVNMSSLISTSSNLTTGIEVLNGAHLNGVISNIENAYDGMVMSGTSTRVRFDVLRILNSQNEGFRIEDVGTGIELSMFATTVSGSIGLNFNVLSPNCTVTGNGFTELNNAYVIAGAKFFAYLLDITEGDEGLNILGELHVGTPVRPAESVFGGGESYTSGMLVYTETALGVFTDVSADARSISASTFTFTGVAVDHSIYIASTFFDGSDFLTHHGLKVLVDSAAIKGAGEIVIEYWNGSSWAEENGMEVKSGSGFYPHANQYFEEAGFYHLRYNPLLVMDAWTKNDPIVPALGTGYYWIRLRIKSPITTAPIFEQFKLHTSRFEINSDGWIEYFGKARPIGQLALEFSAGRPLEGNMQSQSIYVNENLGSGLTSNKFTASGDILGVGGFIPFDADTSAPLKLQWAGMSSVGQTIEWTVRWGHTTQGDSYYTSDPGVLSNLNSILVNKVILANQMEIFEADLPIPDMLSRREGGTGDEIWISIQPSTITGTFALTSSQIQYTKWCEGGHI